MVWVSGSQCFEGLVQTESGGGQCLVCGRVFTFMHNAKVERNNIGNFTLPKAVFKHSHRKWNVTPLLLGESIFYILRGIVFRPT